MKESETYRYDYIVKGDVVFFNLYNTSMEKTGEFKVDAEDLNLVRDHRWFMAKNNHVKTNGLRDLSHVILGLPENYFKVHTDRVVDHINCDPTDNRKENLRITTYRNNARNSSCGSNNTTGFVGVSYHKEQKLWQPQINASDRRVYLKKDKDPKKAVYSRYVAEELLFGSYVNQEDHNKKWNFCKDLPEETRESIRSNTITKLQKKGVL